MKKQIGIVAIMLAVLICLVGCSNINSNKNNSDSGDNQKQVENLNYSAEELLDKVISKAIEIDPDTEYGMSKLSGQKNVINSDNLEDILGLIEEEFNSYIDGAMESKPDDACSPHSIVFVKVKDKTKTAEIAEKVVKNTSPYRFGCLKPDVIMGAYYGEYIVIIDSDEAEKDVVLKALEDVIGAETTKITRDNDWNTSFFDFDEE